eukprot:1735_1
MATIRTEEKFSAAGCNGNTKQCLILLKLSNFMNKYRNQQQEIYKYFDENSTVSISDHFNHFLAYHNTDKDQFECISTSLFGANCNVNTCTTVSRHFRNVRYHEKSLDCKALSIKKILDTMHCHIYHAYDIGVRLTKNERKQIDDLKSNNNTDIKLTKLQNLLHVKKRLFEKLTQNQRYSKENKYLSNLCRVPIIDKDTDIINGYSYSFPFTYHIHCKDLHQTAYFALTYAQLYVTPKFDTLKNEIVNNKIGSVSVDSWNIEMGKMLILKKTQNAKRLIANTKDYGYNLQFLPSHPVHFGYTDGECIQEKHLMCLIIYCACDILQQKFTETYRPLTANEQFEEIKERHSNYCKFAKYLKEAVDVFGKIYDDCKIQTMYHGINKELIFDTMAGEIFGPLSTTYSWNVAIQFSCNNGLVVELVPGTGLKYFSCDWLSPFSYEAELFFIGGFTPINFVNVTDCKFGWCYKSYIQSLRMIANMTSGYYFMNNPSDVQKINRLQTRDLCVLKLPNVSEKIKQTCVGLIHHELNRNGYKTNVFKTYPKLYPYIDQLLHRICMVTASITINYKSMFVNILDKCDGNSGNGYIGYSFLQSLFCVKEYEGINLDLCMALFPNLKYLSVVGFSAIDSNFLNCIYSFIESNIDSHIEQVELGIEKQVKLSNVAQQAKNFKMKFKNIGFGLFIRKNQIHNADCLVISKM